MTWPLFLPSVFLCLNTHRLDSDIYFHHSCAGLRPDMWRQRGRLMESDKPPTHAGKNSERITKSGYLFFVCLRLCLSQLQAVKSNCSFICNCMVRGFTVSMWKHLPSECVCVCAHVGSLWTLIPCVFKGCLPIVTVSHPKAVSEWEKCYLSEVECYLHKTNK